MILPPSTASWAAAISLSGKVKATLLMRVLFSAINRMLENKTLINNVALTLPLSDIAAAHEAVEGGKIMGNVVVTL